MKFLKDPKLLGMIFLLAVVVGGIILAISNNDNFVSRYVNDQSIRSGAIENLFRTGIMPESNTITTPVIGDVSMYTARRRIVNPRDTAILDPVLELQDISPVHYVSTPAYNDLQASLEGSGPKMGPPTAIRI